jgi:hypothetical protein
VAKGGRGHVETEQPGAQPPIEVFAVPVLLLGLVALGLALRASDEALMRTVGRPRRWHSPRALRTFYIVCGGLLTLLGLSGLLFG